MSDRQSLDVTSNYFCECEAFGLLPHPLRVGEPRCSALRWAGLDYRDNIRASHILLALLALAANNRSLRIAVLLRPVERAMGHAESSVANLNDANEGQGCQQNETVQRETRDCVNQYQN